MPPATANHQEDAKCVEENVTQQLQQRICGLTLDASGALIIQARAVRRFSTVLFEKSFNIHGTIEELWEARRESRPVHGLDPHSHHTKICSADRRTRHAWDLQQ